MISVSGRPRDLISTGGPSPGRASPAPPLHAKPLLHPFASSHSVADSHRHSCHSRSWHLQGSRRGTHHVPQSLADFALPSLLPANGPWGVYAGLILAGAFGTWSERTRLGKELSGALVATLAGMALANCGYLPPHCKELKMVFDYILPLAIPMLLYSADLRRILRETGRLLLAFLLGAATTVAGTVLAMKLFPLGAWLGQEGWKIASALCARHIGGAVNYMAVSDALSIDTSIFGAGLAADDLILTLYFTSIYTLAKTIPPDPDVQAQMDATPGGHTSTTGKVINVPEGLAALSISAVVCYMAHGLARAIGFPEQFITIVTAITVLLATAMPAKLQPLVPSAEGLAAILMQVFFATVGASANVGLVIKTAPVLFLFSFIALAAHLGLLLGIGKALGFSRRDLLLASNANIGGPSTVAGMAAAKGWRSQLVPAILTSTLGYALGSFTGLGLGYGLLRNM